MQLLETDAAIRKAALTYPNPMIRALIAERIRQLEADGFDIAQLASFLIVEAGDATAEVEAALGFPLLTNIINQAQFGEDGFQINAEFITDHGGIHEIVTILSDDGRGEIVLVPDIEGVPADLLAMCMAFATPT